ncbi:ATP-dependent Clp protease ATP-binding subunit [Candidatus Saccharibacteria bacterium]|nr:ATP-dependent Clp protease ATP-binding subunit [Candidatus Saccharibacteria bacterium]
MNFEYHSLRAREARAGKILGTPAATVLMILMMVAMLAGGIFLFVYGNPLFWSCLSGIVVVLMILYYTRKELVPVPAVNDAEMQDINNLLSNNLLAVLPKNPTVKDLAMAVAKTNSGKFMHIRYGITSKLLLDIAGQLPNEVGPVFQTALKICQGTDSEEIHGAIIATAIIANYPGNEMLLKRMRLEMLDLLDGVVWFNYLNGLVKSIGKRRHTGGIGRDLSFGYIPTLEHYGQNISELMSAKQTHIHLASHQEVLAQMIEIFGKDGRQNVALIGPEGSGRTTIVQAFSEVLMDADNDLPKSLKYRQIFQLDAAALLSSAAERGHLEGLVTHVLNEAYAARNIIIWLENAQLFFEDGVGSIDITNILLPILEAGKLRMILTMDRQKFLEISARKPALANAMNKIMVRPANQQETMKIMQDQVPMLEFQHKCSYTIWAMKEAYRLSEKYIHDVEMPGRALTLLDISGSYADERTRLVTSESVQRAVEETSGVKVFSQENTTADDKARLLNMEALIHQRMIDQEEAVRTVSDALRRAAAGVRNESKPIGTFLFLGPTGVGKTELAKALSEVYFGGEKHIIRLDMNEFVTAGDVSRLIADGAEDELSLTAQVMKQPFSVVLLDEIEKAHPQVLTTLLQMLDEGILRDIRGREVSFRDTIVVATSNAGAEMIRNMVSSQGGFVAGENGVTAKDSLVTKDYILDQLMKSGEFRPEFINRFDEICLFKPLSQEDCLKVLDIIVAGINKTLAPQKITVVVDDDAKKLLVESGYDPELGARPMRRIVTKTVENLVAKSMLSGKVESGATVRVTRDMVAAELGTA